jgi:ribosomal protein S18 acetylase RimI-like enzyme
MHIEVVKAELSEAERLRTLRLTALDNAPYAFGAKHQDELLIPLSSWQDRLKNTYWCFVTADGKDLGLLAVDKAEKDRKSDCWISSWWISEEYRGKGIPKLMLDWVDALCGENNWRKMGLGVWPENTRAISAYIKLGFVAGSEPMPSRSVPGLMYLPMFKYVGSKI